MSSKDLFPYFSHFKSLFLSEPHVLISKDVRKAASQMGSEAFYELIQEIKKGKEVEIGERKYSKHSIFVKLDEEKETLKETTEI